MRRRFCKILGVSKSSFYCPPKANPKDVAAVRELRAAHLEHPFYGVRRLALHLTWSANKTRQIVGWWLGSNRSAGLTRDALLDALSKHQPPTILHSDQGSEYLSYRQRQLCRKLEIRLSCSSKGSPWQNGFIERWFGQFKLELGKTSKYRDIAELHEAVALRIYYYNNKRIHLALKTTPDAYASILDKVSAKKVA